MPTGPKGEKRPADVIGAAVKVMRIATGEEPEDFGPETGKDKAAAELGRKGGAPIRERNAGPIAFNCPQRSALKIALAMFRPIPQARPRHIMRTNARPWPVNTATMAKTIAATK
jgi:hypothetical protein